MKSSAPKLQSDLIRLSAPKNINLPEQQTNKKKDTTGTNENKIEHK